MCFVNIKKLFQLQSSSFPTYLSGTTLLVGLRKVEQIGLDLLRSESESVKTNQYDPLYF